MANNPKPDPRCSFNVNAKEFVPQITSVKTINNETASSFDELINVQEFVPRRFLKHIIDNVSQNSALLKCVDAKEFVPESLKIKSTIPKDANLENDIRIFLSQTAAISPNDCVSSEATNGTNSVPIITNNACEDKEIKSKITRIEKNVEKFYIGIDSPYSTMFNLKSKLLEDRKKVIMLIEEHTKCFLQLRGKGSGYIDESYSESNEPLHILAEYTNVNNKEKVKHSLNLLITDLHEEFQKAFPCYGWACKNPVTENKDPDNTSVSTSHEPQKQLELTPRPVVITPNITRFYDHPLHLKQCSPYRSLVPNRLTVLRRSAPNLSTPNFVDPSRTNLVLVYGARPSLQLLLRPPFYANVNPLLQAPPVNPMTYCYVRSPTAYASTSSGSDTCNSVKSTSLPQSVILGKNNSNVDSKYDNFLSLGSTIDKFPTVHTDNFGSSDGSELATDAFIQQKLDLNENPPEDVDKMPIIDLSDEYSMVHFNRVEKLNERRSVDKIFKKLMATMSLDNTIRVTTGLTNNLYSSKNVAIPSAETPRIRVSNNEGVSEKSEILKQGKLSSVKQFVKQFNKYL